MCPPLRRLTIRTDSVSATGILYSRFWIHDTPEFHGYRYLDPCNSEGNRRPFLPQCRGYAYEFRE